MVLNCCSLRNKVHKFSSLIEVHEPDVVFGTETWLDSSCLDSKLFPEGFSVFRRDRNLNGGGIFIAVKKALNCDLIFSDPQSEFLICSLRLSNSRPIMLVCVYRPPNGDSKLFKSIDSKLKELKLLQNSEHPIIMAGDFNLPSVNWDAKLVESNPIYGSTVNRAALQLSLKYGLAQVVNKPTRVVSNNILDLIFVRPDSSFANLVVEQGISDHEIVVGQFKLACLNTENNNKDKFFRNYKKAPVHTIAEFLELEFPKF